MTRILRDIEIRRALTFVGSQLLVSFETLIDYTKYRLMYTRLFASPFLGRSRQVAGLSTASIHSVVAALRYPFSCISKG
jgi:hypothetical protein